MLDKQSYQASIDWARVILWRSVRVLGVCAPPARAQSMVVFVCLWLARVTAVIWAAGSLRVPCPTYGGAGTSERGRAQCARRTPFGTIAGQIGTALRVSRGDERRGDIKIASALWTEAPASSSCKGGRDRDGAQRSSTGRGVRARKRTSLAQQRLVFPQLMRGRDGCLRTYQIHERREFGLFPLKYTFRRARHGRPGCRMSAFCARCAWRCIWGKAPCGRCCEITSSVHNTRTCRAQAVF